MMTMKENMRVMMRRISVSPHEPLSPAMNLKTTPALLTFINFCGVLYFLIVTLVVVSVSFAVTLPALYSGAGYWIRLLIGLYLLFQVFGNFLLVWQCSSFCDRISPDALPGGDWRHCADCSMLVPPRSHHCPLCRHCVAVRDHHCFFTASCVGRDNQRHFIAFCFNCAVGTAYAAHVAFQYVSSFHGDGSYSYLVLPAAVVRWILGWQTGLCVLFVGFTYVCAVSCLGSIAVVTWQIFMVLRGQTSHEFITGKLWNVHAFTAMTMVRNVRSVFGPYWPVVFLCPWPVFPIYTDSSYMKSI